MLVGVYVILESSPWPPLSSLAIIRLYGIRLSVRYGVDQSVVAGFAVSFDDVGCPAN